MVMESLKIRVPLLMAAVTLAVSCSNEPGEVGTTTTQLLAPTTVDSIGSGVTTTTVVSNVNSLLEERVGFRACFESIGQGRRSSKAIRVGPVSFMQIDLESAASIWDSVPPDGNVKVVLVLDAEAVGPVTVELTPDSWEVAGLLYSSATFDAERLEDTHTKVSFQTCPGEDAQHAGGFMLKSPACITIRVVDEGASVPIEHFAAIPFGVPIDPCVTGADRSTGG